MSCQKFIILQKCELLVTFKLQEHVWDQLSLQECVTTSKDHTSVFYVADQAFSVYMRTNKKEQRKQLWLNEATFTKEKSKVFPGKSWLFTCSRSYLGNINQGKQKVKPLVCHRVIQFPQVSLPMRSPILESTRAVRDQLINLLSWARKIGEDDFFSTWVVGIKLEQIA